MIDIAPQNLSFLLADDHLIVRQGLRLMIEDLYNYAKIFHASGLNQIMKTLQVYAIDILVLDAQFPDGLSLSLVPKIKAEFPHLKILIFTSFEEEKFSLQFIEAGANGFLTKLSEEKEIKIALKGIVENGYYYPTLTKTLLELSKHNPSLSNPLAQLSEREIQIALMYAKGYGNLEISNELDLKQNTVSTVKHRIFKKLKINTIVELIEFLKIHYHP